MTKGNLSYEEVSELLGEHELPKAYLDKKSKSKREQNVIEVKEITLSPEALIERDFMELYQIAIDGEIVFEVSDGEPEDNSLGRNFSDIHKITSLMRAAYDAGKAGKEIKFTEELIEA